MRKPLVAVLGLVSFVFLADMAAAGDPYTPHPTEVNFTRDQLRTGCNNARGTFNEGGAVTRSYSCTYIGGVVIECNKDGKCQTWWTAGSADKSKTGAATTTGAAASQKK